MKKKTYIQPGITVVSLQHQEQLMNVSGVNATSTSNDVEFNYDQNGDNPGNSW